MIRELILFRPFFSLLLLLLFSPFCTYEPTFRIHPNVGIIGGLVGHNCNTIIGCSAAATVNLKASGSAGGIAGANYSIPHNNNQATITACFSTGEVSGGMYNGGVVGRNDGTVTACYSTGDVTSSGGFTGGVVGYNGNQYSTGTINDCYWSGYDGDGIGYDNTGKYTNSSEYFNPHTNMVNGNWTNIAEAMNEALTSNNYPAYWNDNGSRRPTLNWE